MQSAGEGMGIEIFSLNVSGKTSLKDNLEMFSKMGDTHSLNPAVLFEKYILYLYLHRCRKHAYSSVY